MLSLVSLFLVTLLVSTIAVWGYRRMPEILDFLGELFSPSDSAARSMGGKARSIKLRSPRGETNVPWGW